MSGPPPYVLVGMVEHENLAPAASSSGLLAEQCERLADGIDVLVAPCDWVGGLVARCPPRKVNLAGLVVNEKTRRWMI